MMCVLLCFSEYVCVSHMYCYGLVYVSSIVVYCLQDMLWLRV